MATGIPDPDETPAGPAYEGRLLARPDDEVVDQGAGFDVRTLLTRRSVLGLLGIGVGTAALAACTPTASSTVAAMTAAPSASSAAPSAASGALPAGEIPDETAGPYPGDGSNGPDVLSESGIVRADIRSSIGEDAPVDGVPLEVTIAITDMASGDAPFEGVAVYAWHCDAEGRYSMYSEGVEDASWLRGVQVADADGRVVFQTIVPGAYAGRWTHIHFEVYPTLADISDASNAIATSQIAFPQDMLDAVYRLDAYPSSARNLAQLTLESDGVFGEDGGALQMATITGDVEAGYAATLVARVDTTTTPTGGGMGGGPRP